MNWDAPFRWTVAIDDTVEYRPDGLLSYVFNNQSLAEAWAGHLRTSYSLNARAVPLPWVGP
jgi:hypothetical protein